MRFEEVLRKAAGKGAQDLSTNSRVVVRALDAPAALDEVAMHSIVNLGWDIRPILLLASSFCPSPQDR